MRRTSWFFSQVRVLLENHDSLEIANSKVGTGICLSTEPFDCDCSYREVYCGKVSVRIDFSDIVQ